MTEEKRETEHKTTTSEGLYDEAKSLAVAGKEAESRAKFEEFLSAFPNHAMAHNDLGVLMFRNGEIESSIDHLRKALALSPDNTTALRNLADVYSATGAPQKALEVLMHLLSINQHDCQALLSIADICSMLGKNDEARFFLSKVLTISHEPDLRKQAVAGLEKIDSRGTPGSAMHDQARIAESPQIAQSEPLVSIIIPVYNKLQFTKRCVDSIFENVKYPHYELIIVDNGSNDGSFTFFSELASSNSRVKYLHQERNLGFVQACNLGAASAEGEFLIMLNNDTQVHPGWMESLVDFVQRTPDCGVVGSKLLFPDGSLQEAGGIIFKDGIGWNYGRGKNRSLPKFNFVREVDYVSSASLMVRKIVWERVGGFDAGFAPAYYEDADLCFAARSVGYKVYYHPHSVVTHYEETASRKSPSEGFRKYQEVNRPKFVRKWKDELASQLFYSPSNVEKASTRGIERSILVADPKLPLYDRNAGSLHLLNIMKILKEMKFHVTFVSRSDAMKEHYVPMLERMGIETIAGDPDAMRAIGLTSTSSKIDYEALFKGRQFEYALINFWHNAEYFLPLIRQYSPSTKIIIDTEDVHFVREMREAETENDIALFEIADRNKECELDIYRKADEIWVVTEEDRQALLHENIEVPVAIRPVVHELPEIGSRYEERSGILFVGNFNHRPNIDAMEYFVHEVFPEVRKHLPDVTLFIVGNDPDKRMTGLVSENVVVTGYVEDLSEYYRRCRASVAPLRFGAGLKGKIVESLSFGAPIVASTVAVEGTGLNDGENVLVADTPAQMAEKIAAVYSDETLWRRLSAAGREKVEAEWSFRAGKEKLGELFSPTAVSKTEKNPKLSSIVILTFNQLDYTKITVDSIRQHTKSPYEIIVVDNASTDGTVEYLKAQKDIRTIFNRENLGFPAGCNQGMEIASGGYVVLLNNDAVVTDNWLEGLIECAESDARIGIVGPMCNYISGYQLERNVTYDKVSGVHEFAEGYREKNRHRWTEVARIAGFCMLIKREVIEKIGGLDTVFGVGNCEDDDYCVRSNLAGFRNMVAGDVFVHHFGSKSFMKHGLDNFLERLHEKEKIFADKWGISPSERWMKNAGVKKQSPLFVPLALKQVLSG